MTINDKTNPHGEEKPAKKQEENFDEYCDRCDDFHNPIHGCDRLDIKGILNNLDKRLKND